MGSSLTRDISSVIVFESAQVKRSWIPSYGIHDVVAAHNGLTIINSAIKREFSGLIGLVHLYVLEPRLAKRAKARRSSEAVLVVLPDVKLTSSSKGIDEFPIRINLLFAPSGMTAGELSLGFLGFLGFHSFFVAPHELPASYPRQPVVRLQLLSRWRGFAP